MKIYFTLFLIFFGIRSYSQRSIDFTYDASGNRILKKLKVEPISVFKNNNSKSRMENKIDSISIANKPDYSILIYPNPTNSVLNIETIGLPIDTVWQLVNDPANKKYIMQQLHLLNYTTS